MKKTKILATIGPASMKKDVMKNMVDAGMDAIRINASHSSIEQYKKIVKTLRSIEDLPIFIDTQGPELRILAKSDISLKKNDPIAIGYDEDFPFYFNTKLKLRKDDLLQVDDAIFSLKVTKVAKDHVEAKAVNAGTIRHRVRLNIPGMTTKQSILTDYDKKVLKFAKKINADYIALSYTTSADDIKAARDIVGEEIAIIAKIENEEGVDNIDAIIKQSDGVMVARGDLGVEIPSEKLPIIQKHIIRLCNQQGKLVITATQMLQSMISNPRPTRAETSDVANAILDGTDVVMLSGETAIGKYPVAAIKEMTAIAKEVEPFVEHNIDKDNKASISQAISTAVHEMARSLHVAKVITLTRSGYTARIISRFKLAQPIIALTPHDHITKRVSMYYGVKGITLPKTMNRKECTKFLLKNKEVAKKDLLLYTSGTIQNSTNLIEVHRAKDVVRFL